MQIIPRYWSGSSVSFRRSAEVGLSRDKVTDARRGPPGDRLDVVSEAIIAVVGMQFGHGQQVAALGAQLTRISLFPCFLSPTSYATSGMPGSSRGCTT